MTTPFLLKLAYALIAHTLALGLCGSLGQAAMAQTIAQASTLRRIDTLNLLQAAFDRTAEAAWAAFARLVSCQPVSCW